MATPAKSTWLASGGSQHPRGNAGDQNQPSQAGGITCCRKGHLQCQAPGCWVEFTHWDAAGSRACSGIALEDDEGPGCVVGVPQLLPTGTMASCVVPPVPALPLHCSPGLQGHGQSCGPSQSSGLQPQSSIVCRCMWFGDFWGVVLFFF